MKMGKPHLIGSLLMMVAAIAYSVWSFTAGSRSSAAVRPAEPPPTALAEPPAGGTPAALAVDPASLPPVPDVALDRLPQFPRNPFVPVRPAAELPVVDVTAPVVEAPVEAELVVNGIMYAPPRLSAVVNDRRVGVGDRIGAETIVDILPNGVVVESPLRGRRTIEKRRPGSPRPAAPRGGAQ
jgi:hypothetical protein